MGEDPIVRPTTPRRFRRIRAVLERRQPDLTVLMERVHKPHNFSAVLRTCDAVGVHEAHLVPTEAFHAKGGIASGSHRWVPVRRHEETARAVAHLREAGFRLVAAHPAKGAVGYREVDYTGPVALLLGTELHGLSDGAVEAADARIRIPMAGMVRSLNVSVAAAVVLYEAQRQRREAGHYGERRLDDATFETTLFEWVYPRIAERCREAGAEYPRLGPEGEILGPVPR